MWKHILLALGVVALAACQGVSAGPISGAKHHLLFAGIDDGFSSAPGYIVELDPTYGTYQDSGCSTPATNDGHAVCCWESRINNYQFVQATGSKCPALKLNIVNSLPVVRFDGSDDFLAKTDQDIAWGSHTIYWTFQGTFGYTWAHAFTGDVVNITYWIMFGGNPLSFIVEHNRAGNRSRYSTGGTWAHNTWYYATERFIDTHASHKNWKDGVEITMSSANTDDPGTGVDDGSHLFIGIHWDGSTSPFAGDYGHFVAYDTNHDDTTRAEIENILAGIYGL
jgi:hypothetical protein